MIAIKLEAKIVLEQPILRTSKAIKQLRFFDNI